MLAMGTNHGISLTLFSLIVGLGCVMETQTFGNMFPALSLFKGKSLGDVARRRIADLHNMRDQLQKSHLQNNLKQLSSTPSPSGQEEQDHSTVNIGVGAGSSSSGSTSSFSKRNITTSLDIFGKPILLENRMMVPFSNIWDSLRGIFALKKSRNGFLSRILPNSHVLLQVIKMRNEMDPSLRDYLTGKYNSFLTNLVPYSEKIGVPPFVLNAMKVSSDKELHWHVIEKLLETTSVEELIQDIPDFSPLKAQQLEYKGSRPGYEPVQSRVDEELVSDQEPDATIKGHKKKYTSYGIRLGNRRNRPNKGDLAIAATSTAIVGPDRTGYEYSAYADQYGLYGHDSYDTAYGKGYDEYNQGAATNKGYVNNGNKAYDEYSYRSHKGTDKNLQTSSSYGHSTHYSPKSSGYGHSGGGGGGGGYGHGGGSGWGWGGSGGGWGGGGHMMKGMLDPFSILGCLSFLTFLGLLFQQSLNASRNMTMGREDGRGFGTETAFGRKRRPVELTLLNFDEDIAAPTASGKNRHIRSLEQDLQDDDYLGNFVLQDTWKEIVAIEHIQDKYCRHERLCLLIQDIIGSDVFNIFKDELERKTEDKEFLNELYRLSQTPEGVTCLLQSCYT